MIQEAKTMIYEKLWINENQAQNSKTENFLKWIVDVLVIDNCDLAIEIYNTNGKVIIEALKALMSWEWIKQMAKALWESFVNLFTGNAYEKWKAVWELWLVWTWIWVTAVVWRKALKVWIKEVARLRVNKESLVKSPEIKWVISDTNKKVNEVIPKKQVDFNKMLVEDIAKLWDKERLEAGSFYLQRKLTPEQEKAIIKAHEVWFPNKDWKFDIWDLRKKYIILEKAWFNDNEIRTLMEKWVCGKEKLPILPKLPSLYDDPDYDFLANYKDILWENLTQANIMWEWVNGIVFRHSVDDVVVKVRKPWIHIHDLWIEIQNHWRALVLLENFNGINKGANIYIPEILKEDPRWFLKWYFTMEKINWQTLTTKMFRDLHPWLKNELPWFLDSLSDKDIINLLLNKYSETPANLKKLFDDNSSSYVAQIKKDNPYLSKFLDYLKENKLDHTDLHSGNIMIDKDWRIYIIDFWRVN